MKEFCTLLFASLKQTTNQQQKQGVKSLLPTDIQLSKGWRTAHHTKCIPDKNCKGKQGNLSLWRPHTAHLKRWCKPQPATKCYHCQPVSLHSIHAMPSSPWYLWRDLPYSTIKRIRRSPYIPLKEFLLTPFLFPEARKYFRPLLCQTLHGSIPITPFSLSLLPAAPLTHGLHAPPWTFSSGLGLSSLHLGFYLLHLTETVPTGIHFS